MDEADWDRVVNVDLKGTFLCSRYALEAMVARRSGAIINIASVHTVATLASCRALRRFKGRRRYDDALPWRLNLPPTAFASTPSARD